ncbi:hypothetical protein ACQ4LE_001263 [Meloidogyne hapla]|uniref:G_PROTEIN_RECEP_F1_2 domain-containing protein n=1 Tax=Meloidogyne hapla TaxID=6305 RepID=A0A1I8B1R8_MELHA
MILITLILDVLFQLCSYFFINPYNGGGIEEIKEINDHWNFILIANIDAKTSYIFLFLVSFLPYLIISFCAIKMIRYVNSHTGYDNEMKKMLKQLTLTLIILAFVPIICQAASLFLIIFFGLLEIQDYKLNYVLAQSFILHLIPVVNPIISILTNRPYRRIIFCKSKEVVPIIPRWVDDI